MPMRRDAYPSNWKQISLARREKAGWKCEWCGAPNHAWVARKRGSSHFLVEVADEMGVLDGYALPDGTRIRLSELPGGYDYDNPTRIILTVAHLGTPHPDGRPGDKHDKHDVREENLAALCQRCHLLYDIDEHMQHAKETRLRKKIAAIAATGQKTLFEGES